MQLNDQQKKSAYIAVACLFLLSAFVLPPRIKLAKATQSRTRPAPLGASELKIGMNLYYASNNYHFGTVIDLDRWYEFPDGTIRPGALLRTSEGFESWTPVEKLRKAAVVE